MEDKYEYLAALKDVADVIDEMNDILQDLDVDCDEVDVPVRVGGPIENLTKFTDAGRYAIGKYNEVVAKGGILGEGKNVVIEEINKVKNMFKVKDGANKVNPQGPGSNRSYDLSGGERAVNVQAAGARPIDVNFDTDIKVRTYGDINLTSDKVLQKYPVIMSRQTLDFSAFYKQNVDNQTGDLIPSTESIMADYVNSVLYKMNNIAQANVNFSTQFTYQEVALWLSTLCTCLNAYYGIYSFIQFSKETSNKNDGMTAVRRSITPVDLNLLDVFNEDITQCCMPDNLVNLFYMLNANYRFEELPKSPIIKITSADIVSNGVLSFDIPGCMSLIADNKFQEINRKVFRAIPTWRVFPDRELPMYGPETYHSRNFNTIFINSGHVLKATSDNTYRYLPNFDSNEANFQFKQNPYYSNTNDLDGLTTSLYAVYDAANAPTGTEDSKNWLTGLFKPRTFTQFKTNRAVWVGGQMNGLDSSAIHRIPFVNELAPNGDILPIGFGVNFEQIYGLDILSLRETSKELVDWMFELEKIPIRKLYTGESSPKPSSGKRSRVRRKPHKGKKNTLME